jgi:predicted Fe-Mo cluster-binding NifX family protein
MPTIAIPHWQGRVSPVFDAASHVLLADVDTVGSLGERELVLDQVGEADRAGCLAEAGADVLICGAISRPMQTAVESAGLTVIPHICGDVHRVLAAYAAGALDEQTFCMPGCGRGRHRRGGSGRRGGVSASVGRCNRRRGLRDQQ